MQFALAESKPVQAGPDAPQKAICIYCARTVMLYTQDDKHMTGYTYLHTSDFNADECQKLRDSKQLELDKVLNVKR